MTIGRCNGCNKFCSPNKESFLIHMAASGGTVPEVLKIVEKDDGDNNSDDSEEEEEVSQKQKKEKKK